MSMGDEYLTTVEVAEIMRMSPETVRYWRHIGTGPASFRVGRRVLYARSDVQKFIDDARAAATAASAGKDGGR
ncbi:helix-turn-helix domain-containing protein [Micromonospora sp. NPDC048909]|uniref:helix-turn-helix domain-containing protein n=1 Tax=Micromonospora sp. NPDC048909 TaxID=3155643 RepID=UPI0033DBEE9B